MIGGLLLEQKLPQGDVTVIPERCKGCDFCVRFCPTSYLALAGELTPLGIHPPVPVPGRQCVECHLCEYVCPEFAIYVRPRGDEGEARDTGPARGVTGAGHPLDPMLRPQMIPHLLCPGCGIGTTVGAFLRAVAARATLWDQYAVVTGIGCTGRVAGWLAMDSYHTTHGRPLAFATGLKLANPRLHVVVISGDGDLFAIGGNHFLHAARRNLDLTVICLNNFNYGMTGGQVGPTTPPGAWTTTSPYLNQEKALDPAALARACGAAYVARWTAYHVKQIEQAVREALDTAGFAFIEVVSPCPTYYGRFNKLGEGADEMEGYRWTSCLGSEEDGWPEPADGQGFQVGPLVAPQRAAAPGGPAASREGLAEGDGAGPRSSAGGAGSDAGSPDGAG